MGRPKTKNKHLPKGVSLEGGRYYYRRGKEPRLDLGRDFVDAMAEYGLLFKAADTPLTTMNAVCDRYLKSIEFTACSERTRKDYLRYLVKIRGVFGRVPPRRLTAPDVVNFRDGVAAKSGVVQANRHLELLKLLCRLAVEWGGASVNPASEVKKFGKKAGAGPRERYVTEGEFAAVYALARPAVQVAMDLALLTGLRRENLVTLTRQNITDEGLAVQAHKGGKRLLFVWAPDLRKVVDRGLALWPTKYPVPIDQPIILAKGRHAFTGDGLFQAFATARDAAVDAGEVDGRFTIHDIRAKSSSDEETVEVASARLGHQSTTTTQRTYRRKPAKAGESRRKLPRCGEFFPKMPVFPQELGIRTVSKFLKMVAGAGFEPATFGL